MSADNLRVRRVRHELRRRQLSVRRITWLTPAYVNIVLAGDGLAGFTSLGFDDHVKLFIPGTDPDAPVMRDYTPRRYDATAGELEIEFAIHRPAGPATAWALAAKIGDTIEIGGPRGSFVLQDDFDWYLFIADEAALPAVGRRLEELRPGVPVHVLALATTPADPIPMPASESLTVHTLPADETAIVDYLARLKRPVGEPYVWIAGEAELVRSLRPVIVGELGFAAKWVKAAAYWRLGAVGEHEIIEHGEGQ